MKHLIIGYGNMGKRHGAILNSLGDRVAHIDIGDSIERQRPWDYASVLICTPAETHAPIIGQLVELAKKNNKKQVPLFCEKPFYTKKQKISYSALTMVSCNWRFCSCARKPTIISYPHAMPLDLIHFLDLFWHWHGEPKKPEYSNFGNSYVLSFIRPPVDFAIIKNDSMVRPHTCAMFVKQMRSWRHQLRGKEKPCNPFSTAKKRTDYLIDLIAYAGKH